MGRRYVDPSNVVHDSADRGSETHITLCEWVMQGFSYETEDLLVTENATTCVLCLAAPRHQRARYGHP